MTEDDRQRYRYAFGTAEFDESTYELRVGGVRVSVERKPLELLLLLLRQAGAVVTRDELHERLWPRVDPVDYVMANAVRKLRQALGDARQAVVVTQRGVGYRLGCQPVQTPLGLGYVAADAARLRAVIQRAHSELNEVDKAIAEGELAVEAAARAEGPRSPAALEARLQLAADLARGSRFDDAEAHLTGIESDLAGSAREHPQAWVRLWWVRSDLQAYRLQLRDSLSSAEKAFELLDRAGDVEPRIADGVRTRLGIARRMSGDYGGSESVFRELIAIQQSRGGSAGEALQRSHISLARCLMLQKRTAEAMEVARGALARLTDMFGRLNLTTQFANDAIAGIQFKVGDHRAAAATWQDVVDALLQLFPRPTDFTVTAQANVALSLLFAGAAPEAEAAGQRALDMSATLFAFDAPRVQSIRYQLAFSRLDQSRTEGVAVLLDGLEPAALKQALQADDWEGRIAFQQGRLAFHEGRFDAALGHFEQAQRVLAAHYAEGPISPALVMTWVERLRAPRPLPVR